MKAKQSPYDLAGWQRLMLATPAFLRSLVEVLGAGIPSSRSGVSFGLYSFRPSFR